MHVSCVLCERVMMRSFTAVRVAGSAAVFFAGAGWARSGKGWTSASRGRQRGPRVKAPECL